MGLWEELNNINFNLAEFSLIKSESPKKAFTMTPSKWCTKVNAIGITYDKGKYSVGTFAHIDIALEFASWIDNLFKLYLIKEFKRLKRNEALKENTTWNVARILSKMNYLVHTDAIKNYIIPTTILEQKKYIYEEEDDVLNVALFGMTAKEWKAKNPELAIEGNIRDNADLLQLIILNNLQNINARFIEEKISQSKRLIKLNNVARKQMEIFKDSNCIKELDVRKDNIMIE